MNSLFEKSFSYNYSYQSFILKKLEIKNELNWKF